MRKFQLHSALSAFTLLKNAWIITMSVSQNTGCLFSTDSRRELETETIKRCVYLLKSLQFVYHKPLCKQALISTSDSNKLQIIKKHYKDC